MTEQKKYSIPNPNPEPKPDPKPFANLIQGAGPESGLTKEAEKLSEPSTPVKEVEDDIGKATIYIHAAIERLELTPKNSQTALAIGKLKGALEKLQG